MMSVVLGSSPGKGLKTQRLIFVLKDMVRLAGDELLTASVSKYEGDWL